MIAMPGIVLHANVGGACPHGGQLQVTPSQFRVQVSGQPVATSSATLVVIGCPGVNGVICTTVRWANLATRVLVGGQAALLQAPAPLVPPAVGNAAVVGPPPNLLNLTAAQARVVGS